MYIRKDDNIVGIREGLKQVFENPFTIAIGQKEIIKMKNDGIVTDRDLDISKFLFDFKFATLEQICSFLKILANKNNEETSSEISIRSRLDKLIKYRILNRFMLTEDETLTRISPDALSIYCLDLGGRYLLAHYSNKDTIDWYTTVNMKDSGIVNKNLCVTEFYISLMKTCPDKVKFFNVEPETRVGRKNVSPSFDMCLDISGNNAYFIGEIVRDFDFPIIFRDQLFKLESLLESNSWKKYYYDSKVPPILFLFADSDEIALEVGRLVTEATEMDRFRISTDERIKQPLYETGAFLRYVEEDDELQGITATTFLP